MIKLKNFIFKLIVILFILFLFIFLMAKSYSKIMFKNISNNFLRLHIIANSDSTEDQILKYEIRDAVIEYMQTFFIDVKTKEDAFHILETHLDDLSNLSTKIAETMGYNYDITVSIGNYYFPTKEYSSITLPEGYYDALKIEIGESSGQNWWCVMYPSLCIIDTTNCKFTDNSDKMLKENIGDEEYNLITSQKEFPSLKFKFKLVEFFENI